MASRSSLESSVIVQVTPRFDLFYSLRALDEGSEIFDDWRSSTERCLEIFERLPSESPHGQ